MRNGCTPGNLLILCLLTLIAAYRCAVKDGLSVCIRDTGARRAIPNCIAKVKGEHGTRVGAAILGCSDLSSLTVRRPIERGFLVNPQQQRDIWAHTFSQVTVDTDSDTERPA